jgi:hypothetical protein
MKFAIFGLVDYLLLILQDLGQKQRFEFEFESN